MAPGTFGPSIAAPGPFADFTEDLKLTYTPASNCDQPVLPNGQTGCRGSEYSESSKADIHIKVSANWESRASKLVVRVALFARRILGKMNILDMLVKFLLTGS